MTRRTVLEIVSILLMARTHGMILNLKHTKNSLPGPEN